jgi:hypothetical protein
MKKLSILLLLLVQVVAYGQSFRFVPGVGIRDAQDSSKGFIVFNFPGMTADAIKAAVVAKIPTIYKPVSGRIQPCENNGITLIASTENNSLFYIGVNAYGWSQDCGVGGDFTMNIYFKDGKVRYDAPSFQRLYVINSNWTHDRKERNALDSMKPIYELIDKDYKQIYTILYFHNLIRALNSAVEEAASKPADW